MSDLNRQLKQQHDQMVGVIADKDRIIKKLQADIEKYKAGSDDDTALITSQLKVNKLSVNQELTDDEKEEISTSKEQAEASDPWILSCN